MSLPGDAALPSISILSSVWNEEHYLDLMIESLRTQEFDRWELLIVDDGSTDSTASIVTDWCSRDQRIKAVSLGQKLGKAAAFNLAFEHSTGSVIILMAGDDIFAPDSLRRRWEIFPESVHDSKAAAFFKLQSFSDDPKFHGMTLPRGSAGSRSGPGITMTRPLAEACFPVPPSLPNEDTWLGTLSDLIADVKYESTDIAVQYRIHSSNSNPRHKPFDQMTTAIHRRALTARLILESDRYVLSESQNRQLAAKASAEDLRYAGKPMRLLFATDLPLVDRLALASMSHPRLWAIRQRFYRHLTGWRGR